MTTGREVRGGYARTCDVLEEGWHQVAPVPRRLHVYEVGFLTVRPIGPEGGEGARPCGAEDECAQVPFDPGAAASAVGIRWGLRARQVLKPRRPLGDT